MSSRYDGKSLSTVTEAGVAGFVYLDAPDTGRQYSDGKYKITISFDEKSPYVSELRDQIESLMYASWPKSAVPSPHSPLRYTGDAFSTESRRYFIRAKTASRPPVVDAMKRPLSEDVVVATGDVVKVALTLATYDAESFRGVTAYLDAVQLLQKAPPPRGVDLFKEEPDFINSP